MATFFYTLVISWLQIPTHVSVLLPPALLTLEAINLHLPVWQ